LKQAFFHLWRGNSQNTGKTRTEREYEGLLSINFREIACRFSIILDDPVISNPAGQPLKSGYFSVRPARIFRYFSGNCQKIAHEPLPLRMSGTGSDKRIFGVFYQGIFPDSRWTCLPDPEIPAALPLDEKL